MSIDKQAFRSLNYGMYLITANMDDGTISGTAGCVVNTFAQITSSPFQVSVAINKENVTASAVQKSEHFACTVLAQSATMELIGAFGFRTSSEFDKLAGFQTAQDIAGVPYVAEQTVARFSVRVTNCIDAGTHLIFVGEVEEAELLSDEKPMTYAYYHQVKGGKTPPKASSYIGTDDSASSNSEVPADKPKRYGWQCMLCGHIVEMEELPDDFKCPICGAGKEMFERIEL